MINWDDSWHLKIDNVSKTFDNKVDAVKNADFFVKKGEFLTILGPSGSGKTTLLRMIAGFEFPNSGEIYLNGKSLTNIPPNKRPVNTVFQNYALFPHMTTFNNISFGLLTKKVPKKEIKKRVTEIIELVSLTGLENRLPGQLSGGQAQRVALARALVCKPEILLSDESLGALDLKLRKQTQIALKQIQRSTNITFVHVTHDQEESFTMSDRIVIMNNGKIEQIGTPLDLYFKPATLFVGGFIGENNLIKIKIFSINNEEIIGETLQKEKIVIKRIPTMPKDLKVDENVYIFIRPESLNIGDKDVKQNKFHLDILNFFTIGSEVKILFRLNEKETLMAKIKTELSSQDKIKKGEKILVSFSPEEIIGIFKSNNIN